jgi:hypothetical protein
MEHLSLETKVALLNQSLRLVEPITEIGKFQEIKTQCELCSWAFTPSHIRVYFDGSDIFAYICEDMCPDRATLIFKA